MKNEKLTLVTYEWHPRRQKTLLNLLHTIDPSAEASVGNGYGILISEKSVKECTELFKTQLDSGIIRNIM